MAENKKITEAVEALNRELKEIERKKAHLEMLKKKQAPKVSEKEVSGHEKKMKDDKELQMVRIKEKLVHAVIVFVVGHLLLLPLYLKYPHLIVGMFVCASISLGFICLAVIDYT